MYNYCDIVAVAKRENNNKRKYLLINKFQGKHAPVVPSRAFGMFDSLAEAIPMEIKNEKLMIIGFAETATAIGTEVASKLSTLHMQTTRELIEGVEYIFFSEEHSHATEQKIIKTDLDKVYHSIDRIMFVEDEITTGNTILNAVKAIKKQYKDGKMKFSVASILNELSEENLLKFEAEGIDCFYLIKNPFCNYEKAIEKVIQSEDGKKDTTEDITPNVIKIDVDVEIRRLNNICDIMDNCKKTSRIMEEYACGSHSILVLGTEEFMYPGMFAANELEKKGNDVTFHATTRSPIIPSLDEKYPINSRYKIRSLYDAERTTYVYNLKKYDKVFVVTDAHCENNQGLQELISALKDCGNHSIFVFEWRTK